MRMRSSAGVLFAAHGLCVEAEAEAETEAGLVKDPCAAHLLWLTTTSMPSHMRLTPSIHYDKSEASMNRGAVAGGVVVVCCGTRREGGANSSAAPPFRLAWSRLCSPPRLPSTTSHRFHRTSAYTFSTSRYTDAQRPRSLRRPACLGAPLLDDALLACHLPHKSRHYNASTRSTERQHDRGSTQSAQGQAHLPRLRLLSPPEHSLQAQRQGWREQVSELRRL